MEGIMQSLALLDQVDSEQREASKSQVFGLKNQHAQFLTTVLQQKHERDILSKLREKLTLTAQDKNALSDTNTSVMFFKRAIESGEADPELREESLKQLKFQESLNKLEEMKQIKRLMEGDSTLRNSVLLQSIEKTLQEAEDSSYEKLVQEFKAKGIHYFDTPLMCQSSTPLASKELSRTQMDSREFLQFMQVTMKLQRERDKEGYRHIVNQLINCRANFVELSYSQMIINSNMNQSHLKEGQAQSIQHNEMQYTLLLRQLSVLLSWLKFNLINETQILQCSALDRFKFVEVLNVIFGDRLPQRILLRIQAQIDSLVELNATVKSQIDQYYPNANQASLFSYFLRPQEGSLDSHPPQVSPSEQHKQSLEIVQQNLKME
mmetsp:Transcript_5491/g.9313  ORF Transcript_5491/g.9313 Transcript_5491/m.9313 type:complete len:378 (-) Transcript_5491:541-1674(-)